jgi:hypothetical protein
MGLLPDYLFDPSTYAGTGGGLLARLPPADQSQQQPQPQIPAPSGGLAGWLGGNSNALIGLGAGIAGGGTLSDSIARGLQGLLTGRQADQKQAIGNATMQALVARGLDPQQAALALAHPELMKVAAARLYPSYRFERARDLFGAFDPATGSFKPLGLAPASASNRLRLG